MMKHLNIIYIFLFLSLSNIVFSEPIILTDNKIEFTLVTSINKDFANIGVTHPTNIKTNLNKAITTVNYDGDILISNDRMIKGGIIYNLGVSGIILPIFSKNGDDLIYHEFIDEKSVKYNFYNIIKNQIIFEYTFHDLSSFNYPFISRSGSTIVIDFLDNNMFFYTRTNNEYIQTNYLSLYNYGGVLISESGNRVFYSHKTSSGDGEYFYMDKKSEGWSDEIIIPNSSTFSIREQSQKFQPISSINDGKSLIVITNNFQLALTHENNGVWSELEIAGDYEDKTLVIYDPIRGEYEISPDYPIANSDDGRVIALEQPREFWQDGSVKSYDIYVYIKDQSGQWSKHQVNPNQIGATAYNNQEVQLSGDGSKLFWVPDKPLVVIPANQLK